MYFKLNVQQNMMFEHHPTLFDKITQYLKYGRKDDEDKFLTKFDTHNNKYAKAATEGNTQEGRCQRSTNAFVDERRLKGLAMLACKQEGSINTECTRFVRQAAVYTS